MKVVFYYHIPVFIDNGRIKTPSYLGVFIDALAKQVDHLYLILHESLDSEKDKGEYSITETNVTWVNLGRKTPAWHRVLFYRSILKSKLTQLEDCEVALVRAPSPLAPFFKRYLKKSQVCYMIVGDYFEGLKNMQGGIRVFFVKALLIYIEWIFNRAIKGANIIVNSPYLLKKYEKLAKNVKVIKTTTISDSDFFYRIDTCAQASIQVLYTGRIDPAKGLFELIEAVAYLRKQNFNVACNIVGAVEGSGEVKEDLINWSKKLGIEEHIIFHGWKSLGEDLNMMYRTADIYVIPSYHEGFPRTIWEALANSLPVIATNVGAIPFYLQDSESALIIKPKDSVEIERAIRKLIENKSIREKLIKNGHLLAREATQDKQAELLINILRDFNFKFKNVYGKVY